MRFRFEGNHPGRLLIGKLLAACAFIVGSLPGIAQESTTPRWPRGYTAGQFTQLTSPAIGPDHTVYVGVRVNRTPKSGMVLAVRPDGTDKWAPFNTPEEIVESSPALSPDGATVYIGCTDGRLYAINSGTGTRKWEFDTGHTNHSIYGSPAVARDGTIYIGATDTGTELDSVFWAVSPVDGQPLWGFSSAGAIETSPAIGADGTVYFAGGTQLYALTPEGKFKWSFEFKGPIYAAPAIGPDGTIYVGSDANEFVAISPAGTEKWRLAITAGAGAAVGPDHTVYIGTIEPDGSGRSTGKLYALDANGKPRGAFEGQARSNWPLSFTAPVVTVPAIRADGTIIFGCNDRTLRAYAIDRTAADGTQRWSFSTSDVVNSSPVIDTDGSIYFGSGQTLYALPGSGSPLSEYASWPMYNHDVAHRAQASKPINGGTLLNLATRGLTTPANPVIAGFVLEGTRPQTLLVRAVGPTLGRFVANSLPDPVLGISISGPTPFFYRGNDNWEAQEETNPGAAAIAAAAEAVGAFPLDAGSKDAAVLGPFAPTLNYTAVIETRGGSGVALAELYDADRGSAASRLRNVSTRGFVGAGENVLIAGLVIGGPGQVRVLVRGIGPALSRFGVSGVLSRPVITIFNENARIVDRNAGWSGGGRGGDLAGAASLVGAFSLPNGSADSALILTLEPGAYTVQLSSAGTETGVGLVEVYALPF